MEQEAPLFDRQEGEGMRIWPGGGAAVLLFVASGFLGCGGAVESERENVNRTRPALSGWLVFQRGEGKKSEIWKADLSTYAMTRLTDNDLLDEYPRWSPDGSMIAFYSDRDGTRQIYVMDAAGRNVRKLTGQFPVNEDPTWSPDGRRICFWAKEEEGAPENLYVIGLDGKGLTNVTRSTKGTRRVPDWSPDGRKIAFTSNKFLSHQIYVVDADGKNEVRLTSNPRGACRARWSPDGKRIAYSDAGYMLKKNVDIWEMDADGGNKTRLTTSRGKDYDIAYSPDGSKIIFSSNRSGHYELYVMNRDGSGQTRLTYFNDYTRFPDWRE